MIKVVSPTVTASADYPCGSGARPEL